MLGAPAIFGAAAGALEVLQIDLPNLSSGENLILAGVAAALIGTYIALGGAGAFIYKRADFLHEPERPDPSAAPNKLNVYAAEDALWRVFLVDRKPEPRFDVLFLAIGGITYLALGGLMFLDVDFDWGYVILAVVLTGLPGGVAAWAAGGLWRAPT